MSDALSSACTAFVGNRRFAWGPPAEVALAIKSLLDRQPDAAVLAFEDATGKQIDFDLRGSAEEIAARLPGPEAGDGSTARGRGRPKLGVVPREVTLLPRHWEWLSAHPGGASVTLRRLVEDARRTEASGSGSRAAQTRAYHFMSAMAGNLPGFEEATRALFAGDRERFSALMTGWPADVRDHAIRLLGA